MKAEILWDSKHLKKRMIGRLERAFRNAEFITSAKEKKERMGDLHARVEHIEERCSRWKLNLTQKESELCWVLDITTPTRLKEAILNNEIDYFEIAGAGENTFSLLCGRVNIDPEPFISCMQAKQLKIKQQKKEKRIQEKLDKGKVNLIDFISSEPFYEQVAIEYLKGLGFKIISPGKINQ